VCIGAVDSSKPCLNTAWRYAKVELRPPSLSELPQIQKTFSDLIVAGKTQKWKNLTVKVLNLTAALYSVSVRYETKINVFIEFLVQILFNLLYRKPG
jgi:hypothetical protein